MSKLEKTIQNIKDLKIQGATNIAIASIRALANFSNTIKVKNKDTFIKSLQKAAIGLYDARPNEPGTKNGLNYVIYWVKKSKSADIKELKKITRARAEEFVKQIEKSKQFIAERGVRVLRKNDNIFTHCHTSTVTGLLKEAKRQGKIFQVFNTETRPLYQGRQTSEDLIKAKIKTTLVTDAAASFLISKASGKDLMMDIVLLGCDVILPDGSCVNKIGSYGIALAAKKEGIPLFIVSSLLKLDKELKSLEQVKIERRKTREVWAQAPKGLKIINFAFDKVPANLITAYITEFGIIRSAQVKRYGKRKLYWV